MTTWADVIHYVRTRYEVLEETADWLRIRLRTEADRTQQVAIHYMPATEAGRVAWLEISSPVGRADKIDLRGLLELAGTSVVGGAAIVDGVALLKHTMPLANLRVREEFERSMALLVTRADALEHELTRVDQY